MLKADNAHDLALLYHLNSEPWLNLDALRDPPGEIYRVPISSATTALPSATASPLRALLERRRSCRRYRRAEMPIASLAAVLQAGYGAGALVVWEDARPMCARPAPSAGGYHPLQLLAATTAVSGLPDGLYRYDPWQHTLQTLRVGPVREEADACLVAPQFVAGANVLVFIATPLDPTLAKYGARGYRYLTLEAGHVAQNICLAAVEEQLGTLCVGGFFDRAADDMLGLQEMGDATLYCIALGFSED
jgi:SagB-type dehydrogenase family enzyme